MLWCDLDLIFEVAVVILDIHLQPRNCCVDEVYILGKHIGWECAAL